MFRRSYTVDLSAHLAECEMNYLRLCRLLPDMESGRETRFSLGHSSEVCITVRERAPYTSILDIEQNHPDLPDLKARLEVRVCHDAGVAEVCAFAGSYGVRAKNDYPNEKMHQRDEKQQWNRFLGEWLQHCLEQGRSLSKTEDLITL